MSTKHDRSSHARARARAVLRHAAVVGVLAALTVLASCDRTPSKSDYVSAQVGEVCAEFEGDDLRACRLAVIKEYKDTPLEELQRRFPPPEPRPRPSCAF